LAGILSYGAYIPTWRISRDEIAKSIGSASLGGERAVASWDEDSLTMGVEAGFDCLAGVEPKEIDGLFFATVSSPLKEKQVASLIASALDLRKDIYTSDFTGSLRAGTLAVKAACDAVEAGSMKKALVIASDARKAMPRSDAEQTFGDGAAALLIGRKEEAIAEIEGLSTVVNPIPGPWKRENDRYTKVFDVRLDSRYGVLKDIPQAVASLMEKYKIQAKDVSKFAFYAPDSRSHAAISGALKIDAKTQAQDLMFKTIGVTGTAHCLLVLIAALEQAKADARIICASYGEGSDALLLKTTGKLEQEKAKHKGTKYIASKKILSSYGRFLSIKKEIDVGWPDWEKSSVVKYWRDENWLLPLYGMKCNKCGTLQYPVRKVCTACGAKDKHSRVKLARRGKVFTFTHDYLLGPGNYTGDGINPTSRVLVDLEDGCRIWLEMTDSEIEEINIGTQVELTFRLLHQKSDFPFYGWRARPLRASN
jgi:hydroxymethylglutaryl-CoA synthase